MFGVQWLRTLTPSFLTTSAIDVDEPVVKVEEKAMVDEIVDDKKETLVLDAHDVANILDDINKANISHFSGDFSDISSSINKDSALVAFEEAKIIIIGVDFEENPDLLQSIANIDKMADAQFEEIRGLICAQLSFKHLRVVSNNGCSKSRVGSKAIIQWVGACGARGTATVASRIPKNNRYTRKCNCLYSFKLSRGGHFTILLVSSVV
jgi:hypothetical protein